jgi:CheY-like chemotaxis protein
MTAVAEPVLPTRRASADGGVPAHEETSTLAAATSRDPRFPASCNAAAVSRSDTVGMALRTLIVDDNAAFLDAARALLEREGLAVVGVASTTAEALERSEELQPDVVLVDIMLGRESGFALTRHLVLDDRNGGPRVILISTHAEADFADLIAASPAAGFLPKSELSLDAIARILDGGQSAGALRET